MPSRAWSDRSCRTRFRGMDTHSIQDTRPRTLCNRCRSWYRSACIRCRWARHRLREPVPDAPRFFEFARMPGSWLHLHLLEFHEKSLEFRSMRVGIDHCGREPIGDGPGDFARVLLNAAVTLIDRQADLVHFLAVDGHRLNALGDKRLRDIEAPRAGDLYLIAAANPQFLGQFHGHFDE